MPDAGLWATLHLLGLVASWGGLLCVSMSVAWAMNVGLTASEVVPEVAYAQPLPIAPPVKGFILTITYRDADSASASFSCHSSRDLVSTDVLLAHNPEAVYAQAALVCREPSL